MPRKTSLYNFGILGFKNGELRSVCGATGHKDKRRTLATLRRAVPQYSWRARKYRVADHPNGWNAWDDFARKPSS